MSTAITPDQRPRLRALRIEAGCHFALAFGLVAALAVTLGGNGTLPGSYAVQATGVFAVIAVLSFLVLPAHLPQRRFGPANRVTLIRAMMIALLAGLVGLPGELLSGQAWPIAGIALAAAVLDGVDGWVARRSGSASRFGARFDMELDGVLILVLSVLVWQLGKAGVWILAAGALRYLFIACQALWPVLARPLVPSRRRQTVCALQTLALVLALAPVVPAEVAAPVVATGLALLSYSFGYDTLWLLRRNER